MNKMETLTDMSTYTNIIISLLIAVLFKDVITNFLIGLKFYLNKNFNESDIVYINDKEYIIVKIGLTSTIFQNTETNKWMYISNDRLKYINFEKQILEKK